MQNLYHILGASASVGSFYARLYGKLRPGSAAWGGVAADIKVSGLVLIYSGLGTVGSAILALFASLPDSTADLSPWNHWRMPVIVKELSEEHLAGPVLVTIEYTVIEEQESKFLRAMRHDARNRRRDGAYQWGLDW